jgi:hypothetical protein
MAFLDQALHMTSGKIDRDSETDALIAAAATQDGRVDIQPPFESIRAPPVCRD